MDSPGNIWELIKVLHTLDVSIQPNSELSTLSHSHLYNHEQQSLRFVEHPYNFNIANKTCA